MELNILRIFVTTLIYTLLKYSSVIHAVLVSPSNNFTHFVLEQPEYLVDKSLMIKELLQDENSIVSIIRPPRWGKNFNLDMIRTFLQIEVDSEGVALPEDQKIHRKLFSGGELQSSDGEVKNLQPLKISNVSDAMEHQGKYPVIWVDLCYTKYCSYPEMEDCLKNVVDGVFESHAYLRRYSEAGNQSISDNDLVKEKLRRYFAKNITREDLLDSLRFASELLFKHFNQKVFILVNDYDTPFILRMIIPKQSPEYLNVSSLLRELFCRTFNDNPYLRKAIFTGSLPLTEAHSHVTSNLNNFTEYTLLDGPFSEFYGFTQNEVDDLMNRTKSLTDRQEIKDLYKGYNHGRHIVYNPWSVLDHIILKENAFPYWSSVAPSPACVEKQLSTDTWLKPIRDLFMGFGIISAIDPSVDYLNCSTSTSLLSLLLYFGYLNPVAEVYPNDKPTYKLIIPNREIKEFYAKKINDRVKNKLFVVVADIYNCMRFLPINLMEGFKTNFQNTIFGIEKFYQIKQSELELCHNDLMLMLIDSVSLKYEFQFQTFPSANETVAFLEPKVDHIRNIIFIGFKVTENVENLTSEANATLQHVKSLKYDIKHGNYSKFHLVKIGIALSRVHSNVQYDVEILD
ncbi:uncharacterized protein LOC135836907 [Planococcus citri]|uniref:uncharacterized protein LOC135836907 n=1 Tax=Planococcus citri TaxID=170843 RepID=UPI0031F98387